MEIVLSASDENQQAWENERWRFPSSADVDVDDHRGFHSALTYAILEALTPDRQTGAIAADLHADGVVTDDELWSKVSQRVPALVRKTVSREQTPRYFKVLHGDRGEAGELRPEFDTSRIGQFLFVPRRLDPGPG